MNSFIEYLNLHGGEFLNFAWPMLWQSSLLIVLVFAADVLLARRIRASVRHALWLVVLVKLLLPPTLALPTSAAWWLFSAKPEINAPAAKNFVVSFDNATPAPAFIPQANPQVNPPAATLGRAGWTLLAVGAASSGLLLWLLFRWAQVTRMVQRATPAGEFSNPLGEARRRAGLRLPIRVKITDGPMSPAVCGLFRPVILLPRMLAEKLSAEQLRAVLLHEAIHVRRKDIWVNCAQALLQIVYWWHPLVWVANARIRRVREEAVDDAVMLALADEAEMYAPTLLEVAKLALNRPLLSLGLVGIMESRSALRQRIERLMEFRAPRKAGLTFASLCGIFVFSAVAVPMGEAPGPVEKTTFQDADAVEQHALTLKVDPGIFIQNVKAQAAKSLLVATNDYSAILLEILQGEGVESRPPNGIAFNTQTGEITTQNTPDKLEIFRQVIEQLNRTDGKCELPLRHPPFRLQTVVIDSRIYQMRGADFEQLASGLQFYPASQGNAPWWSASPEKFPQLLAALDASGLKPIQRPRIQTSNGRMAQFYVGDETGGLKLNGLEFDCKPFIGNGFADLALQSTLVAGSADGGWFTNQISSRVSAENHGGIVLRLENFNGQAGSNLVVVIHVEISTNAAPPRFQQRLQSIIHPATNAAAPTAAPTYQQRLASIVNVSAAAASKARILEQDGKVFYEMGKLDEAEATLNSALKIDPANPTATYYLGLVQTARTSGPDKAGRQKIVAALERIRLPSVKFENLPLEETVRQLNAQALASDPQSAGVQLSIATNLATGSQGQSVTIPKLSLVAARLADVLDAIVLVADQPIKYSIQDHGVVFSAKETGDHAQLFMRTFRVDRKVLASVMPDQRKLAVSDVSVTDKNYQTLVDAKLIQAFKDHTGTLGVDWNSPKGKSLFYNDRLGVLFVKATEPDLDKIERTLSEAAQTARPQIHVKARFYEVPKGTLAALGSFLNLTNAADGKPMGILTPKNTREAMRALQSRKGGMTRGEPEITVLIGRQLQMRATGVQTVVTNFGFGENDEHNNSPMVPETSNIETGPILDMTENVLPDGNTINLRPKASVTDFYGYAEDRKNNGTRVTRRVTDSSGKEVDLPVTWPAVEVRSASAQVCLFDNQTLMLPLSHAEAMKFTAPDEKRDAAVAELLQNVQKKNGEKEDIAFITVTLVDRAGSRIHSDEELPFAQDGIPPQP